MGKLIKRVAPRYPDLARNARIQGLVFLNLTVDETGNVSDVRVVRGHKVLIKAAVDAVRQWKFSPTLLNGEPKVIMATITVDFRLGSGSAAARD